MLQKCIPMQSTGMLKGAIQIIRDTFLFLTPLPLELHVFFIAPKEHVGFTQNNVIFYLACAYNFGEAKKNPDKVRQKYLDAFFGPTPIATSGLRALRNPLFQVSVWPTTILTGHCSKKLDHFNNFPQYHKTINVFDVEVVICFLFLFTSLPSGSGTTFSSTRPTWQRA